MARLACGGLGLLVGLASCAPLPPEAPQASTEAPVAPAGATAAAAAKKPAETATPGKEDISAVLDDALSVVDIAGAALRSSTEIRPVFERWVAEKGPPRASVLRDRASELPPKLQPLGVAVAADIDALVAKLQAGAAYDSEAAKAYGDANSFPSDPRADTGLPRPVGGLSPQAVQLVVRNKFKPMRICYERGLAAQHDLHGRVQTLFAIDKNGDVSRVEDKGSDIPAPNVIECVQAVFRSLRFGPRRGTERELKVVYPIIFNTAD